jgi:hypothetical protein
LEARLARTNESFADAGARRQGERLTSDDIGGAVA